jgi:hypothetical protein
MGPQTRPPAGGDPAGGGPAPGEPSPLVRLRQLGPQWAGASGGAFAGMAQSPERYAAASRLVAAWLNRLRAAAPDANELTEANETDVVGGVGAAGADPGDEGRDWVAQAAAAALLDAWDRREQGTGDAVADGTGLPLTEAERAVLTTAAFAIRYGEVTAWVAARRRRRAMARAAAQANGGPGGWLVLDETGDPAGDPFVAYRRLEVDPVTGAGVLVETRPDESFTGVIHGVQIISVDPATGELTADNDAEYCEFSSAEEREERVSALRADDDRGPGDSAV